MAMPWVGEKLQILARQARELHGEWIAVIGAGPVSYESATWVLQQVDQRAGELTAGFAQQKITIEEHNDQHFMLVKALRRLIDAGCEERVSRAISRAMHDLYVDNPPLPHPRYRFSYDWVTPHADEWARDLEHLAGKPGVRALEVGCFEGQSACWFLDNVLTHPSSRLICVDPFAVPMGSVLLRYFEGYFDHNIAASGASDRVTKMIGYSQVVLRALQPASFDLIYIDGSHKVGDVLQDAVLAWTVLRSGGVVMFDDYALVDDVAAGLQARAPGRALDAFIGLVGSDATVIRRDWQLVLRKS